MNTDNVTGGCIDYQVSFICVGTSTQAPVFVPKIESVVTNQTGILTLKSAIIGQTVQVSVKRL